VGCRDNITEGICRKSSGDGFEVPSLTDFRNRFFSLPSSSKEGGSGDLLPPSPPAEKATARQDQAACRGAGDAKLAG
jgi:hypothetical protein